MYMFTHDGIAALTTREFVNALGEETACAWRRALPVAWEELKDILTKKPGAEK
jgi:hypothetical protein